MAGRDGRNPSGPPQANIPLANPAGVPAENTGNFPEGPQENLPFTVQGPPAVDNGRLTVHIEWTNPDTDWDVYVTDSTGEVVTQSASFGDTNEDAVLVDPPPGNYVAHVVNFDQVDGQPVDDWKAGEVRFRSPTPRVVNNVKEAWNLTCEDREGRLRASRQVIVDRGQKVNVGDASGARAPTPPSTKTDGGEEDPNAGALCGAPAMGLVRSHPIRAMPGWASAETMGGEMRGSRNLAGAGVAILVVLLTGCGGDDDGDSKSSTPATTETPAATQQETVPAVVKVSVGDNFYKPKTVEIRRGQSISWRNEGAVAHTVTSDSDSTVKFDSGTLNPRGAYVLKPTTPGKISYYCTIHGKAVMSGTVTVTR